MTDASTLTAELMALLDGSLPASHLHQAIRLSSVGENGWPYAAQLSLGRLLPARPANCYLPSGRDPPLPPT